MKHLSVLSAITAAITMAIAISVAIPSTSVGATGVRAAAGATPPVPAAVVATFEGHRIDLSKGWGAATACTTDGITTSCYRTQAQMDAARPAAEARAAAATSTCSSSLKLYSGVYLTGSVLQLTARNVVVSLVPYGFSDTASSYTVGACSSHLYDTSSGGGSYPGTTAAGTSANLMVSGWDNIISSVLIS
ncbi:MAG TPA: hypothetical protein VGM78_09180 [Ilumatobacteraceae bacterium]